MTFFCAGSSESGKEGRFLARMSSGWQACYCTLLHAMVLVLVAGIREASPVTIGSQEYRPPCLSGSTIVAAKYLQNIPAKYSGGLPSLTMFRSALSALRLKGGAPKKREAKSPRSPGKKRAAAGTTTAAVDVASADSGEEAEEEKPNVSHNWDVQKAGDLEVLSTRESVLKRPDMWIGDVTTVTKLAWEVIELAPGEMAEVPEDDDDRDPSKSAAPADTDRPADTDARVPRTPTTPTKSPLRHAPTIPNYTLALPTTPIKTTPLGAAAGMPSTPTTPLVGVSAGDGGRRLVARAREMQYNAGVLKTFDEIIVNAVDRQVEVESMREIRVRINATAGELEVWNDGPGIAPLPHKSGKGLVPESEVAEVAFGEFMASTNFDDNTRKRFTGGRFGVGAKATNAWSAWFEVSTLHAESGMTYVQTWSNNMANKSAAAITKGARTPTGFTCIRWKPDYPRFGMPDGLDHDTLQCLTMRVYDLCACTRANIRVSLNGRTLPFRSLDQYASLFWGEPAEGGRERASLTLSDPNCPARLEAVFSVSKSASFEARGIVNGVLCSQGTHIEHLASKICDGLLQRAVRQMKKDKIKMDDSKTGLTKIRNYFRQHLAVIVVALLPNPRFDGQTKEKLTLNAKDWGFPATITDAMVEKIDKKLALVDKVLMEAEARNMAALSKKSTPTAGASARVSIAKYQGANLAGKADRPPCYLLATEGDSAKDLAVAGMTIVGRDCYGVIPLRGVIRNVRPAKVNAKVLKDFLKNAELAAINKVLGLQFGVSYTPDNVRRLLRYDHFVIFCDQDPDGAHIAGELINYFTIMFPSLLRAKPDFVMRLGTPIIRLKPKNPRASEGAKSFFTTAAFRTWFAASGLTDQQLRSKYQLKYLKGLASSNEDDAHHYFQNLNDHLVPIIFGDEKDDEIVDKWFRKNRADDRKVLLSRPYDPDVCVDYSSQRISFGNYFEQEYIHFPHYAIYRTIPHVMDGMKPSQRKVMYTAFRRKYKDTVKVVQFAGAVLETAAYHHGDTALQGAIIAMARRYCGSNNVNLLHPDGQFGSRHSNHAGAARYISAGLEKIARLIFRVEDDAILEYQREDGQQIEPKYFLPVVPMVLINGCEAGIAVGWSSFVPMYNPREILQWLRERMQRHKDGVSIDGDVAAEIPGVIDASKSRSFQSRHSMAKSRGDTQAQDHAASLADAPDAEDGNDGNAEGEEDADGGDDLELDGGEGVDLGGEGPTADDDGQEDAQGNGPTDSFVGESTLAEGQQRKLTGRWALSLSDGFVDKLQPWYDGFGGQIVRIGPHTFKLRGFAEYFEPERKGMPGIVTVTEVGPTLRSDALREAWKERWGPAEVKDAKRKKAMEGHQFLKDEQVYNTATRVHIELTVDDQKIRAAASISNKKKKMTLERLEKILGISEIVSTTNMHLFDASNAMKRFATPEAILEHFFRHRILAYERRKAHQVAEMQARVLELSSKARYCTMVHDGELSIVKKSVAQREADLVAAGFERITLKPKAADAATGRVDREEDEEGEREEGEKQESPKGRSPGDTASDTAAGVPAASAGYEYLLRVSTLSCTTEHARRLRAEADRLRTQLEALQRMLPVDMWFKDLAELEEGLQDFAKRKDEALDKKIKAGLNKGPPKRKHKNEIRKEQRASNKATRQQVEEQGKAYEVALRAKQEKKRLAREVKRRAAMHNSPTAKVMLERLKDEGIITPTKITPTRPSPGKRGGAKGDAIFEAALKASGGLPAVSGKMPVAKGGQ